MQIQNIIQFIEANAALVLLWFLLFQVILVLCILWLAQRIRRVPTNKALAIVEENKQTVHGVRAKVDSLDSYLREEFTRDFGGAMKSFDDTVTAILHQMKDELVQGVSRIENIQTAVDKRRTFEKRIEEGGANVRSLIDAPEETLISSDPPADSDEAADTDTEKK